MAPTPSKTLASESARFEQIGPKGSRNGEARDGQACADAFAEALIGLGPMELRVIHLAISRAADLEVAGKSAEADTLLLKMLRILDDDEPPGVARLAPVQRTS